MGKAVIYVVLILVILGTAAGCEYVIGSSIDEQAAISAMRSAGYTDVRVVGRQNIFVSVLGCSSEDNVKFDMVAVSPNGETVTDAYVCVGWPFKGATIRYR